MKEYLDKLSAEEEFSRLDADWQFIIRKMKKDYEENARVPVDFYSEMVRERSESFQAWREAKLTDNFSLFAPHLEKMIEYTKKNTEYKHPGKEVYNALLDEYEEGMDSDTYDRLFADIKAELVPLVRKITAAPAPDDSKFRNRFYDIDAQKKVQKLLLDYIGFSWDKGAVGETEHPFTLNITSKDVRIANHYHEDDAIDPMFSAIHEGGHAIFEQNVAEKLEGTVGGSCHYMGIHESQSRFFENILGRNKNFWIPIYGKVQELLPAFKDVTLDEFHREICHVRNSLIRTAADEVTYGLHVILRYELEKAIFRDGLPVSELPKLWNEKMREYLQITPLDNTTGVLQDMHWSDGSFGYFPSYLLGSIYDGMYLETITEELGDIDTILAEGRILEITKWLNEKIHKYGSTRLPKEVIKNVCGKEVSAQPLIRHFKEKYSELYGLDK